MPGNFSRARPVLGIIGMAFLAFANFYGAVSICRVMLLAPTSVWTYGDLGEWVLGEPGRYLTVVVQVTGCLIIPCAFLVSAERYWMATSQALSLRRRGPFSWLSQSCLRASCLLSRKELALRL
ncbi:hypothetical protein PC119_g21509 [Phytophthora cactorum]|uniref:Amino acid transporter transmembrane domain-containing protein n=1 Tax=Phytophthora cactorum TaxID=29920 RepID=A0A8T1BGH1_9STRA|nr:hypothetical protein PC117_g21729 [Phytophthora cactorum]KAG2979320.1 hypothetical protein PC119_g21509 [Phytophthora cactorum]